MSQINTNMSQINTNMSQNNTNMSQNNTNNTNNTNMINKLTELSEIISYCKVFLPESYYDDLLDAYRNVKSSYYENQESIEIIYECECDIYDTRYNCIYDTIERLIQCKKFPDLVKIFPEFEIFILTRNNNYELPANFKPFHIQFNAEEYQIPNMKKEDIIEYLRIFKYLLRHNITDDIREICEKNSTDLLILYIAFYNYIIKIKSYDYKDDNYNYNWLIGLLTDIFETKSNFNYFPPIYRELITDETFAKISKYFDCDIEKIKNPLKKWNEIFNR